MSGFLDETLPEGRLMVISTTQCVVVTLHLGKERGVATIDASFVGDRWWLSRALVSKEQSRGKGFGSIALRRLLKEIAASSVPVIEVAPGGYSNNKEQQFNFYLKNGFKAVGAAEEGLFEWRPD